MAKFQPEKFSSRFSTRTFTAYTYKALNGNLMEKTLELPDVDCYLLELGVNDLRELRDPSTNDWRNAVNSASSAIGTILEKNRTAKVVVSLPTPTPGSTNTTLNANIPVFNEELNSWISSTRDSNMNNAKSRQFTVNNSNFRPEYSEGKPCPFNKDMLHLNEYGLKKLCLNMKYGLYRAFNIIFSPRHNDTHRHG